MMPPGPLGESIARLPDNIRAEMARRRIKGEDLADLIGISYATFKRRIRRPDEFTVGNVANMAVALRCHVSTLLNWEAW
jgi:DNA-binding Xre family transcriptional regulator